MDVTGGAGGVRRPSAWADAWALTKPGITALVVVTAAVGAWLAGPPPWGVWGWASCLGGTALLAGGTNALNQYAERREDARMRRTRGRPLPSGRMRPGAALAFAVAISVAGAAWLAFAVNLWAAALGAFALVTYVFVYTPLKRRAWWCTLVGAVPGAVPPLMGWAAVRGGLEPAAWNLFAIVFLWQLPHFFAIAWLCRDDYARAGFPMLSTLDSDGRRTAGHALAWTVGLLVASVLWVTVGGAGALYLAGALVLGLAFLGAAAAWARVRTAGRARRLFWASVAYLPALLLLMVLDRW